MYDILLENGRACSSSRHVKKSISDKLRYTRLWYGAEDQMESCKCEIKTDQNHQHYNKKTIVMHCFTNNPLLDSLVV